MNFHFVELDPLLLLKSSSDGQIFKTAGSVLTRVLQSKMDSSDEAKMPDAKKTILTKTGANSAGERSKRLKENRDGSSSALKPPKLTKNAVNDCFEDFKLFQKEWANGKSPPHSSLPDKTRKRNEKLQLDVN